MLKRFTIVGVVASALLLGGLQGCGKKKEQTRQASQQYVAPHKTPQERQKALRKKIASLQQYGIDVNRTSANSYLLRVNDAKKAALALSGFFGTSAITPEDIDDIAALVDGTKAKIDIDWEAYIADKKGSVRVFYRGKGDEKGLLKKLIDKNALAAALTFDAKDRFVRADMRDIDENDTDGNETVGIKMHGTYLSADYPVVDNDNIVHYALKSTAFVATDKNDATETIAKAGYEKLSCDFDKTNDIYGKEACRFPRIYFTIDTTRQDEKADFNLTDVAFGYDVTKENGKVKSTADFVIPKITGIYFDKTLRQTAKIRLDNFAFDMITKNIDEAILKAFYALSRQNGTDINATIRKTFSLFSELYAHGMRFEYDMKLNALDIDTHEGNMTLQGLKAEGDGTFDDNITYRDIYTVDTVRFDKTIPQKQRLAVDKLTFGYRIENLYNFLPEVFRISSELLQNANNPTPNPAIESQFAKIGEKAINNGVNFALSPVAYDTILYESENEKTELGKLSLNLHVGLKPNTLAIDFNNPLVFMMLIGYLDAEGKLVLPKKDLEQISKLFPPEFVAMLMMYATYEGDNAVFVFEFKNGQATINKQPLM